MVEDLLTDVPNVKTMMRIQNEVSLRKREEDGDHAVTRKSRNFSEIDDDAEVNSTTVQTPYALCSNGASSTYSTSTHRSISPYSNSTDGSWTIGYDIDLKAQQGPFQPPSASPFYASSL